MKFNRERWGSKKERNFERFPGRWQRIVFKHGKRKRKDPGEYPLRRRRGYPGGTHWAVGGGNPGATHSKAEEAVEMSCFKASEVEWATEVFAEQDRKRKRGKNGAAPDDFEAEEATQASGSDACFGGCEAEKEGAKR